jgi:glutamyl-tRNA synthetase
VISKPKLEQGDDIMDFLTSKDHPTRAETRMFADPHMRTLRMGDVVQIERRGFFRVDSPHVSADQPMTLFLVPDGKKKAMSTLTSKIGHQ